MAEVKNILLVGVGGQGTILASKILSAGLVGAGYDVKMSEVHGMAQRGGSVTTQVRYGSEVFSPIIGKGQADILVCFEAMEGLRLLDHLKLNGKVVVNDYKIPSIPILTGKRDYPEDVIEKIKEKASTMTIDAAGIAEDLGDAKTMNVVLLGALVKAMGLDEIDWEDVIRKTVKEKFIDINIKAFNKGIKAIK
ncbi:indolepyruvate oxidoreductase subunit beta [Paramaledivibacter caminithermalis]|jgi:indolepyruvate ferredoxin oxidoreductase beta subunit|uniref:Indolepyruvate ferredoxin oxidoreductase beta subunit n=1 Tax=Paramaledivibacter caminithermalis (strain DSM 15212 / CIP 107654 / DViRD3) TaxID=1121301 RepID=A0A1M6RG61_PARC5|nr:indolepyruvate oxidoreductase subunit beta [Paramaledivibacter caminithermalis]SHK31454.1 indolepyruvate ferredoxin oxidoreductase beta subunit [Paramaledivibacter caminithermalis DSM 15212]